MSLSLSTKPLSGAARKSGKAQPTAFPNLETAVAAVWSAVLRTP
ncbi:hypothetical protein [Rhizohabitans arisaemae]|nr:hypothetical protein [Rhizohabitans arisaemae]